MSNSAALRRFSAVLALTALAALAPLGIRGLAAPSPATAVAGPQLPQNADSGWGP